MAEEELFKIFDINRNVIGTAMRKDVHRLGYWHETFHCWLMSRENNKVFIYLQIRSDTKKEFPKLLDITAAGHLLAHETVYDGVREIKEEIGIDVSFDDLVPAGLIKYSLARGQLIDNEFAHVFLYETMYAIDDYILQKEEVSGIVRAEFSNFCKLWCGEIDEIVVEGMEINKEGQYVQLKRAVNKSSFVPHNNSYYQKIVQAVNDWLG